MSWNKGIELNRPSAQLIAPSRLVKSYAGALAVEAISANAVTKTSVDTRTVTYTEGQGLARTAKVTLASHAGSYVDQSTIVITGTKSDGSSYSETLTIVGTDGGTTLTTTVAFATVSSIVIAAQADALGHIQVDGSDIQLPADPKQLRVGTAGSGALHVGYVAPDGSVIKNTFKNCQAGERFDITPRWVYIDSTVQDIDIFF